jgi:hypothetical protein
MNLEQHANASQRLSVVPADAAQCVVSHRSAPPFIPGAAAALLVIAALAADGDG